MPLPAALQARLKRRGLMIKADIEEIKEKEKKKKKNYKSQPLPPGWFCVPDPTSSHEYYWNVHTNHVSWRHPNDPKADVTYPAVWLQQQQQQKAQEEIKQAQKNASTKSDEKRSEEERKGDKALKQKVKTGKHPSLIKAQRQKEKQNPYGRKGKGGKDEQPLDPMDPASYSDVQRGGWSSGLKEDSDVNTGVDTTANGPLFQQRPYPSPGDILRRNKGNKPPEEEEGEEE